MRLRRYRPIAVLLLGLHLSACARWEPVTVSPRAVIEEQQPSVVRITRLDGSRVEIEDPWIRADSISIDRSGCERVFTADGHAQCRGATAVALSDVQALEVQRTSAAATVVAIPLVLVGFFALVFAVSCADDADQALC